MNHYESKENNSADCHVHPRFSEPGTLRGFTVTTARPPLEAPGQVHTRLVEAGLPAERFVDLQDDTKEPTASHTNSENQLGAERVKGNYGILAGCGLIIIDVDNPEQLPTWLVRVLAANSTLFVSSPHGGEARGHYFYRVEGTIDTEKAFVKGDWGSIRLKNSYAVGPGSVIDHDTYCHNDCPLSGPGRYDSQFAQQIATIEADVIQEVVTAESATDSQSPDATESDIHDLDTRIQRGIDTNSNFQEVWSWAQEGGPPASVGFANDCSKAESALSGHLNFWLSGDTDTIRDVFDQVNPPKWSEEGENYRQSVLETGDNGVYFDPGSGGGGVSWNAIFEVIIALCYDHEGQARTREVAASDDVQIGERQVVNVLNQLKEMGYLDEKRDKNDGRIVYWVVTDMEGLVEFSNSDDLLEQYNPRDAQLEWCRRYL